MTRLYFFQGLSPFSSWKTVPCFFVRKSAPFIHVGFYLLNSLRGTDIFPHFRHSISPFNRKDSNSYSMIFQWTTCLGLWKNSVIFTKRTLLHWKIVSEPLYHLHFIIFYSFWIKNIVPPEPAQFPKPPSFERACGLRRLSFWSFAFCI